MDSRSPNTESSAFFGDFRVILAFPDYMINPDWEVRNVKTGRVVQRDHGENWTIKLYGPDGKQYHRSVRRLYEQTFEGRW